MGNDTEPSPRPRLPTGAELDRQIELTRRQLNTLVESTGEILAGTSLEEAMAALSLTLEELEVTAEELRAQNDELVATRHQLERERQRYQTLFDLAPEAYLVTDAAGLIRRANRQAERLLGRYVGELVDKPLAVLLPADDRPRLRALLRNSDEDSVRTLELTVVPRDGTPHPVSVTVRRGEDPDGTTELRWLLTDGAAHRLAQAELATRLEEARDEASTTRNVSNWQSTLLGAAAHDLRTPLGVIGGTIETLLEHWDRLDAERSRGLLEGAQAQAAKLRRVLRGLMDLSELQVRTSRAVREEVQVAQLVERTLDELPLAEHSPVADIDGDLIASIDTGQVARIIENLVTNAARHTPAGSMIRVTAVADPDRPADLLLTVEDDGPGVPEDIREQIFEPYLRMDHEAHGDGLGLAIVAMFAAFHDGEAWVDDREGGGAAFHVRLADALPAD